MKPVSILALSTAFVIGHASAGSVTLECPKKNYYASPSFNLNIENNVESREIRYEYQVYFGEVAGSDPLGNIRIEAIGSADVNLVSWGGDFKSCRIVDNGSALSCWTAPVTKKEDFSSRQGSVVMTSKQPPGVGRYIAQTFPWKGTTGLNEPLRKKLLPFFDYNEEALTESYYDQAMSACPDSNSETKFSSAVTGFIAVPDGQIGATTDQDTNTDKVVNLQYGDDLASEVASEYKEGMAMTDSLGRAISIKERDALAQGSQCNVKGFLYRGKDTVTAFNVIDSPPCKRTNKTFTFKY